MRDNEPIIFVGLIVITVITVIISVTVSGYLNNKMRTEIFLACIQSDSCSDSTKKELKPIK